MTASYDTDPSPVTGNALHVTPLNPALDEYNGRGGLRVSVSYPVIAAGVTTDRTATAVLDDAERAGLAAYLTGTAGPLAELDKIQGPVSAQSERLGYLYRQIREYGTDSIHADIARELVALRELADVVRSRVTIPEGSRS